MNGTKLVFTDDYETWWGPGWEFDGGLTYTKVKLRLSYRNEAVANIILTFFF